MTPADNWHHAASTGEIRNAYEIFVVKEIRNRLQVPAIDYVTNSV
jgi:hypothetical protein